MRVVRSVTFNDDCVEVMYLDMDVDIRNDGKLLMTRVVGIDSMSPDYAEEIEDVKDAVRRLLDDALEDWRATRPDHSTSVQTDQDRTTQSD